MQSHMGAGVTPVTVLQGRNRDARRIARRDRAGSMAPREDCYMKPIFLICLVALSTAGCASPVAGQSWGQALGGLAAGTYIPPVCPPRVAPVTQISCQGGMCYAMPLAAPAPLPGCQ